MITRLSIFIFALLLFPQTAYCNWEKDALWAYFDALSKGDVKQLKTLLNPNFEYHFYKGDKLYKLSRNDELKSLELILHDLRAKQFEVPDQFLWDKRAFQNLPLDQWNKFRIVVPIIFEDSPKIYTDTLFRGAGLDLRESLTVILGDDHKILKILEDKRGSKRKDELSFGNLKQIYLKELDETCKDKNGLVVDGQVVVGSVICTLLDRKSREPLLTRIDKDSEVHFYWPSNRRIRNLDF